MHLVLIFWSKVVLSAYFLYILRAEDFSIMSAGIYQTEMDGFNSPLARVPYACGFHFVSSSMRWCRTLVDFPGWTLEKKISSLQIKTINSLNERHDRNYDQNYCANANTWFRGVEYFTHIIIRRPQICHRIWWGVWCHSDGVPPHAVMYESSCEAVISSIHQKNMHEMLVYLTCNFQQFYRL